MILLTSCYQLKKETTYKVIDTCITDAPCNCYTLLPVNETKPYIYILTPDTTTTGAEIVWRVRKNGIIYIREVDNYNYKQSTIIKPKQLIK